MAPGTLLVDILIVGVSLAITLLFIVPLSGSLVRVRANYNPKSLQLDAEGVVHPYTGPQVTSFFGMLARVKRIEGWSGLYKGLMPTMITTLVIGTFVMVFFDDAKGQPRNHGIVNPPNAGPFGLIMYSVFWTFVSLPGTIITYRSITTPYRLPYFRPMYSLRVLLTPTERRRPWILYFTPGLLASQIAAVVWGVLTLHAVRYFILPNYHIGESLPEDLSPLRVVFYLAVVAFSTVALCPLEVMTTKLAIQRNHLASEYNSVAQEAEGDVDETTDYSATEEDVIGLRHERDPYTGLLDCAKRVIDEEGIGALYRLWWITLVVALATAVA